MQFVHGNPRHPQLLQQTLSLVIFVTDVERHQPDHKSQCTAAQTGERNDDLFQLVTEQNAENYETPRIKQRTQTIEENEPRSAYARVARQRRHQGAQTRNEFRRHDPSHPVSREEILRPANARIRLERDPAEKVQHALTAISSQIEPNQIGEHRADGCGAERHAADQSGSDDKHHRLYQTNSLPFITPPRRNLKTRHLGYAWEHPNVVSNGARRSRRFDVARSPALAEYAKLVGLLTLKRPEVRAPKSRQLADALVSPGRIR